MAYTLMLVPNQIPNSFLFKEKQKRKTSSKQDVNHWQRISVTKDFINVFKSFKGECVTLEFMLVFILFTHTQGNEMQKTNVVT